MTIDLVAEPQLSTIRPDRPWTNAKEPRMAVCRHCGRSIKAITRADGWHHRATGQVRCVESQRA